MENNHFEKAMLKTILTQAGELIEEVYGEGKVCETCMPKLNEVIAIISGTIKKEKKC